MKKARFRKGVLTALKGIAHGLSTERNIKIQAFVGLVVLALSLLLNLPKNEFILILIVCFLVIMSELSNTALERLIDFIHPKRHKGIGKIKDMMAGVVLLSVILAIIIGFLLLLKPIIEVLR